MTFEEEMAKWPVENPNPDGGPTGPRNFAALTAGRLGLSPSQIEMLVVLFSQAMGVARRAALGESANVVHRQWEGMEHHLDCGHDVTLERVEAEILALAKD